MKLSPSKILLFILGIGAVYGIAAFYLDWRIPRATAVIEVHPTALPSSTGMLYSGYMENQFELILSVETMNLAADRLDTPTNARPEMIALLSKNVTATPRRGTDCIEITAKDPDPERAKKIANAFAQAAIQHRNEVQIIRANICLERFDKEIATSRNLAQTHRANLKRILAKYNLSPPNDDHSFPPLEELPQDDSNSFAQLRSSYSTELRAFQESRKTLQFKEERRAKLLPQIKPAQPAYSLHKRAD